MGKKLKFLKKAAITAAFGIGISLMFSKPAYASDAQLILEDNGDWDYYLDGKKQPYYEGMAVDDDGWWYIQSGKINFKYTGLAQNEYGYWYFEDGHINWNYTGLANNKYGAWYFENGVVVQGFTGIIDNEFGCWCYKNGYVDKDYTGLGFDGTRWRYFNKGEIDLWYSGYVEFYGVNYYVKNGTVDYVHVDASSKSLRQKLYDGELFTLPIKYNDYECLESWWSWRDINGSGNGDDEDGYENWHRGMDFAAERGTPVYAVADGTVYYTEDGYEATDGLNNIEDGWDGYGNQVALDHGEGIKTRYAHLSEIFVKKGDKVKQGQLIGYVGSSGYSYGYHLHFYVEDGVSHGDYEGLAFPDRGARAEDYTIDPYRCFPELAGCKKVSSFLSQTRPQWFYEDIHYGENYLAQDVSSGNWLYYINGAYNKWYTGVVENEYGTWCVINGIVDFGYTGMFNCSTGWYYVVDGRVYTDYTGMAVNDNGWWYYIDGRLVWNYTGMASNENGWWYYRNGNIDWDYTGMASNENGWWYFRNGRIDWNYTGMANNENGWWYYDNGRIDWDYTGMASNEAGWWYYDNGQIDWNHTGIEENEIGSWYYKNGNIQFDFSGIAEIDGVKYNVEEGQIISEYTEEENENTEDVSIGNSSDISNKNNDNSNSSENETGELYKKLYSNQLFTLPIKYEDYIYISSWWSWRDLDGTGYGDDKDGFENWHVGLDFAADRGTPVYAMAYGVVKESVNGFNATKGENTFTDGNGYGNHVVIEHGEGIKSIYAHFDSSVVKVGDTVKQGQLIGYVGCSGKAYGYHLHITVMDGKKHSAKDGLAFSNRGERSASDDYSVDPYQFFPQLAGSSKVAPDISNDRPEWFEADRIINQTAKK